MKELLAQWKNATSKLPWGAQQVFHETLTAVKDGQVSLVYGQDYNDKGNPCLVNAAASMLTVGGGVGIPSTNFGSLVSCFDTINRELVRSGSNTGDGIVSPLAAEILLHNFAPIKEKPIETATDEAMQNEAFAEHAYSEPTDADLTRNWLNALNTDAACEIEVPNEFSEENEKMIEEAAKQLGL